MGETDFEDERRDHAASTPEDLHLAGIFRPTEHGRTLLPRLCGIMTAAADMKDELSRRGLDADDVPPDILMDLFENTPYGAHIIDIGRVLSDVELRDPNGATLVFSSMGFMDLAEITLLSLRLGMNTMRPIERPTGAPEIVVSVTLRALTGSGYC
jgi:hypothetical protein